MFREEEEFFLLKVAVNPDFLRVPARQPPAQPPPAVIHLSCWCHTALPALRVTTDWNHPHVVSPKLLGSASTWLWHHCILSQLQHEAVQQGLQPLCDQDRHGKEFLPDTNRKGKRSVLPQVKLPLSIFTSLPSAHSLQQTACSIHEKGHLLILQPADSSLQSRAALCFLPPGRS